MKLNGDLMDCFRPDGRVEDLLCWCEENGYELRIEPEPSAVEPSAVATGDIARYNVIVYEYPRSSKVRMTKAIMEITGLGIMGAEDFVEQSLPAVCRGLTITEAGEAEIKLRRAGATIAVERCHTVSMTDLV
jgi:ribosomal protein L7/L12